MKLNLNCLVVLFVIIIVAAGCNFDNPDDTNARVNQENTLKKYLATITPISKTKDGLYYIVQYNGGKDTINDNDTLKTNNWVRMNFAGYVLNSDLSLTVYETNIDSIAKANNFSSSTAFQFPIWFQLTAQKMLGEVEGVKLMKKHARYRFIIPYSINGFGADMSSDGIIQPYATLVYDVELIEKIPNPVLRDSSYFYKVVNSFKDTISDSTHNVYIANHSNVSSIDTIKSGDTINLQHQIIMIDSSYNLSSNYVTDTAIIVGHNTIIPGGGLDLALINKKFGLRPGSTATLIIKYSYAFGAGGVSNTSHQMVIPPYTSVICKIIIISKVHKTK